MPCDTITTQSVALAKADADLVEATFRALGAERLGRIDAYVEGYIGSAWVQWKAGVGLTIQATQNDKTVQRVTRAYSRQAVTWAAQRAGWSVKKTADNTLSITRR